MLSLPLPPNWLLVIVHSSFVTHNPDSSAVRIKKETIIAPLFTCNKSLTISSRSGWTSSIVLTARKRYLKRQLLPFIKINYTHFFLIMSINFIFFLGNYPFFLLQLSFHPPSVYFLFSDNGVLNIWRYVPVTWLSSSHPRAFLSISFHSSV